VSEVEADLVGDVDESDTGDRWLRWPIGVRSERRTIIPAADDRTPGENEQEGDNRTPPSSGSTPVGLLVGHDVTVPGNG
jgi:hypothetical protein